MQYIACTHTHQRKTRMRPRASRHVMLLLLPRHNGSALSFSPPGGTGGEKERAARDRAGPRPQCESARYKSPWPTSSAATAAQGLRSRV
jgi:hypothetical protein